MIKKCIGCGVTLQTDNCKKKGFTKDLNMDYCMRCFRWQHYKDYQYGQGSVDSEALIQKINQTKGMVFFFIDFLNLHEEAILNFKKIKSPKVFVVSKLDTIPKSIYIEKISIWLKREWDIKEDILFIQRNSKTSIRKIEDKMLESPFKTFVFAGMTNAGKSTLLNSFMESNSITVSEMPNTTLDFLKLSYRDLTIYDTPGICYSFFFKDSSFQKKANITREIKPKNYPLKSEASLIIERQIRFSLDKDNNVTFFGSDNLAIEKVYAKNTRLQDLEKIEIQVPEQSNLYIKGVCFFSIKQACMVTLYGVKKENVSVSLSFLGYEV